MVRGEGGKGRGRGMQRGDSVYIYGRYYMCVCVCVDGSMREVGTWGTYVDGCLGGWMDGRALTQTVASLRWRCLCVH